MLLPRDPVIVRCQEVYETAKSHNDQDAALKAKTEMNKESISKRDMFIQSAKNYLNEWGNDSRNRR